MMRKMMFALALIGGTAPAMAQSPRPRPRPPIMNSAMPIRRPQPASRVQGVARRRSFAHPGQDRRDGAAGRREARKSGFPYNRYSFDKTWKVVTDTPRFLSLSGDSYSFTGGAHGSPASMD